MRNVLILGCRVADGQPMRLLQARLRTAHELVADMDRAGEHPQVVVSGKGEAEPMRDWLVAAGMAAERIILEPEATSTNENLENAHALLPDTSRWLVVTSNFHARRTAVWAWHLGLPVTVVSAPTPPEARARNYLREVAAFPHSVARVLWRRLMARVSG